VSLRAGLSRSIFLGGLRESLFMVTASRAHKGYLRISLTQKLVAAQLCGKRFVMGDVD